MEQISKMLSTEHENILKVINRILEECDKIEDEKRIDKEFFIKAIDFIRAYADKFHHAKEEELLFKELCTGDTSERMHCNPVEQMLVEHDSGREFVRELEKGVNENNKEMIVKNARGYCYLLKEHIFKEDNILYPMSEEAMDDETKEKMYKEFLRIDKEKSAVKNKYLKFIESLD